jgi:outer membrane protein assembly factor BamD
MPMTRFLLLLLVLAAATPRMAEAAREPVTVAEQYELGIKYMNRGYYSKALEVFHRIRNYHRDDPHAVKAELAIADLHFKKTEWDQARLAYEDFMRMHPRHPDLDYVVYRMGQSVYRKAPKAAGRDQTWTRQALNIWAGFAVRFPESEHRPEVEAALSSCRERLALKELRIAEFYRRRHAWKAVAGRTGELVVNHPDSEATPGALLLLAEARAWMGEDEAASEALAQLEALNPDLAAKATVRVNRARPPDEG